MMRLEKTVLLTLLAAIGVACENSPAAPSATVSAAENPARHAQSSPNPAPQENEFFASGPIIVENQVDVAAQRDGVIAKVLAEAGARVHKGQLLAMLDDRQISAELEAARAKTRSTENDLKNWEAEAKVLDVDYQRAQKMWDAQIISKEQLEHVQFKAE